LGLALQQQRTHLNPLLSLPITDASTFQNITSPQRIQLLADLMLPHLPMNARLQEQHTTMGLDPGEDGRHIVNSSDATIFAWIDLPGRSK
jgi:hypothetical protein